MIGVSEEELKRDGKELKEFINNSRFPSEMFDSIPKLPKIFR